MDDNSAGRIMMIRKGILTPKMLETAVKTGKWAVKELMQKQGLSRDEIIDAKKAWGIYAGTPPKEAS
jgi:predicted alpha-1,6-mannanase (GH76 family)